MHSPILTPKELIRMIVVDRFVEDAVVASAKRDRKGVVVRP